ncbi:hypothetical protein ACROYT_G027053 [Oculina patagonica]
MLPLLSDESIHCYYKGRWKLDLLFSESTVFYGVAVSFLSALTHVKMSSTHVQTAEHQWANLTGCVNRHEDASLDMGEGQIRLQQPEEMQNVEQI